MSIAGITIVMCRAQGHINAALGLATRLRRIGVAVTFVGPAEIGPGFTAAGFDFQPLACLDVMRMPFGIAHRPVELWSLRSLRAVVQTIRADREEALRFRRSFHAVSAELLAMAGRGDQRLFAFDPFYLHFALPLLACGHRVCVLSTKPLAHPDPWVPPYTTHLRPGQSVSTVKTSLLWSLQKIKYQAWELWERVLVGTTYRRLVHEFGQHCGVAMAGTWATRPILFDTYLRGCPEWVLHAPAFELPRREDVPPSTRYLGPCVYDTRSEECQPLPCGDGPLIFVALSTVRYRSRVPLRRRMIELFLQVARMRPAWRFVLAVGDQAEQASRSDVPPSVHIVRFAASLSTLSQASVLVCQAGANFVKEAIWMGVPMLLFPDRADQPGIAARVVHHGLGFAHRTLPTAARVCADIEHLMASPEIARRIAGMQHIFRDEPSNTLLLQAAVAAVGGRGGVGEGDVRR